MFCGCCTWAVIPAAGNSSRMGQQLKSGSKVFTELSADGSTALSCTLRNFELSQVISGYVIATRREDIALIEQIVDSLGIKVPVICTQGGQTRQDSVFAALQLLPEEVQLVAVHDAARAFCKPKLIRDVVISAEKSEAAILAIPAKSTLKNTTNGAVVETIDRSKIWEAQTPQVFKRSVIIEAHKKAQSEEFVGTDESQLVERLGVAVSIVESDGSNFKITTPEDLDFAQWLVNKET